MKNRIFKQKRLFSTALFVLMAFLTIPSVTAKNDSYVIIINERNTASPSNVKMHDVRNFFMLNKRSWPDGSRARPVFPDMAQPSYKVLLKNIIKTNERKLNAHWLQLKQRTGTSQPPHISSESLIISYVANTPGSLGIVSASIPLPSSVKVLMKLEK